MAITTVKVHPAIGFARLGNSPTDFFVGPEIPGAHDLPTGGYKDNHCRVKRQGARFRLFGYDQTGALVKELTAADGAISWTVHLANAKGASGRNTGVAAADVTIDPGSRTLNGTNQHAAFDNGTFKVPGASAVTVPLGEIRTDVDGRLLVLGGFGSSASPTGASIGSFLDNDDWYDDISDGPVTASIKIGAQTFTATGAWVICPPPRFSPFTDNVITLYDTLYQWAVDKGWRQVPTPVSYTQHIYPILERAAGMKWVNQGANGNHVWTHPVMDSTTRNLIWNKLKANGGSMPYLNDGPDSQGDLTATQVACLLAWKDGTAVNDWTGVPVPPATVTPDGLDRAALEACAGAAFYPGIEAGGYPKAQAPFRDANNYSEAFRLDHTKVHAGDVTRRMALPWQADFNACASNWWPVPRPNEVLPQAGGSYQAWARGIGSPEDMVAFWHTLGFVVPQGASYVEANRCGTPSITLVTPALNFRDVPQGPGGTSRKLGLAVTFEVQSVGSVVTLQFDTGPTHVRLARVTTTPQGAGPTVGNDVVVVHLWLTYETGPVNEAITDEVTVLNPESGLTWSIPITANTIARKTTGVALVLDRSGSMNDNRGDGTSKVQSLRDASIVFLDKMLAGDALGIVAYNQAAQRLQDVLTLGDPLDPFDVNRTAGHNVLLGPGLNPGGATSIGNGIVEGRAALLASAGNYQQQALVVLTDGNENEPLWIADVASSIDHQTYAVGLGTATNTSAAALQTLSGNTGGYLLITGAITGDNFFLLHKYFLQILAGVSNAEVVLDPDGFLTVGTTQVIPVRITDEDMMVDFVLLTPYPQYVDFRLRTPTGQIITPATSAQHTGVEYVLSRGMAFYRVTLPTELQPQRFDHGGTWQMILRIGRPQRADGGTTAVDVQAAPASAVRVRPKKSASAVPGRPRPSTSAARPRAGATAATAGPTHTAAMSFLPALSDGRAGAQATPGLRYSALVHAYSNISLQVTTRQASHEVGAVLEIAAHLTESGMPMTHAVSARAEVTAPDGGVSYLALAGHVDGGFTGQVRTNVAGTYRVRVRATGASARGVPFDREKTATASVWAGGDRPPLNQGNTGGGCPCEILNCLFGARGAVSPELAERLARVGFNVKALARCLEGRCRAVPLPESERGIGSVATSTAAGAPVAAGAASYAGDLSALIDVVRQALASGGGHDGSGGAA